jgi:hypothetical protein
VDRTPYMGMHPPCTQDYPSTWVYGDALHVALGICDGACQSGHDDDLIDILSG